MKALFNLCRMCFIAYPNKALTVSLMIVSAISGLLSPLLHGALLDALHARKSTDIIFGIVGITIALTLASTALGYWQERLRIRSSATLLVTFRRRLWSHLGKIPLQVLFEQSPGVWIQKATGDVALVCGTFQTILFNILGFALFFLGTATIIFLKAPLMLIFFAVAVIVGVGVHHYHQRAITRRAKHLRNGIYNFNTLVFDLLMMQPLLRMFGLADLFIRKFDRHNKLVAEQEIASQRISMQYSITLSIEMAIIHGVILCVCIILFLRGHIALGDIWVYDMLVSQLSGGVNRVLEMLPQMDQGIESARSLIQTLQIAEEPSAPPHSLASGAGGEICLKNVNFHYNGQQQEVIQHCTLSIKPNESVCLIGKNGIGKSTLIRLILGILQPSSGVITVTARNPAIVPQHITVFRGSVLENIRLYDTAITSNTVKSAIHRVGLDSWLTQQPHGLHSRITAETISGGELQRLAIARAIVRSPDLLIVDEITNNLDIVEKERICAILQSLKGTRTIVSITHDIDTIGGYDRVFVLTNHSIIELAHNKSRDLIQDVKSILRQ